MCKCGLLQSEIGIVFAIFQLTVSGCKACKMTVSVHSHFSQYRFQREAAVQRDSTLSVTQQTHKFNNYLVN